MHGIRQLLVFLVLLLGCAQPGYAQDFPVVHYTMDDGLPSNSVYSAYRDSKGYMWIATDKGIARYNGIRFEIFTTFNGLPDNEIFFFQEDHAGRIWLATYNGELCYFKDDTFHTSANTAFLKLPFKSIYIKRIELESDSSISIVFNKNPKFINIRNNQVRVIDLSHLDPAFAADQLLERQKLSENRYRLTGASQVFDVDTLGHVLQVTHLPGAETSQENPQLWKISFTQNQAYIISEHFLFSKEGELLKTLNDTFLKKNLLYIVYHNSLSYFFGTNNGIIFNGNTRLLQGLQVTCITQDKPGNYWATSLENGVYVLDKFFMNTRLYKEAYQGKVRFACALKDHIYFMAKDNNLLDLSAGRISPVVNFNAYVTNESKLVNSRFYLIDTDFHAFYFTNKNGIGISDLREFPLKIKKFNAGLLYPNALRSAIEIDNSLYINADVKILYTDLSAARYAEPLKFTQVSDSLSNDKIFGFAQSPDNHVWYSTINSLYKVVNGQAVLQKQFNKIPFELFGFFGDYMVGYTHSSKLYICRNYNYIPTILEIQGQNCIWNKFYQLDDNHILISTNNYYRVLTLNTQEITIVDNLEVPLQAEEICVDGANICFFKNGLITSIALDRFLAPSEPPRLFYSYLHTGNQVYKIHRELRIPFNDAKTINVGFSTLSFSGKNVTCFYSVSRGDREDNWQPLEGNEINLVNPSPGYYTIKIKAKTVSSAFSPAVVFSLYVDKPFWTTWWFITLCVWSLIGMIWGVMRYRLTLILKKRELQYQSEIKFMKSEYKAMNALMNPHFIFNTLNNVQSLVNANDKVAANDYLRIFADLIRQNMHNISKELIPLQKEVDLVGNYLSLEKLRFEDKLTYNIIIEDDLDLTDIMVPPLLIQPLVENSIKHGILPLKNKIGIIDLHIYEKENSLYIEVRDNGVGMGSKPKHENDKHESYGLGNIRKRIDQLSIMQNKKIQFIMEEKLGKPDLQTWTVVTIIIPF